jgi:N-acetylglutamate synthase-like GNAT family acetyltransferase
MEEEISLMNVIYTLADVCELFKDIIQESSAGKVKEILSEYRDDPNKTLYGYFIDKKIAGIIGLNKNGEIIEIEHLGMQSKHRDMGCDEKLINHIKNKYTGKKIITYTDKEGKKYYEKYGYKTYETGEEEGKENKRYKCEIS